MGEGARGMRTVVRAIGLFIFLIGTYFGFTEIDIVIAWILGVLGAILIMVS